MPHTDKTNQAYNLLRSYARTWDQEKAVDSLYSDILGDTSNDDQAVLYILGLIQDGLRYGNWFWNMPPNAEQAKPRKVPRKVTATVRRSRGTGDMNKGQW